MGEVKLTEVEKMQAAQDRSQPIGEFLDWLFNKGFLISRYVDDEHALVEVHRTIEQWLADMFDIDLQKVEMEKQHLLTRLRLQNLERDLVDG